MMFLSLHSFILSTFRKDCEAMINLCASEDGTALVVNQFNDNHNHEISKVGSDISYVY